MRCDILKSRYRLKATGKRKIIFTHKTQGEETGRDGILKSKPVLRVIIINIFIWFWGMILVEGAEMTPLVHQWIGVNPGGGNSNINIIANGARYRFYVSLSLNT